MAQTEILLLKHIAKLGAEGDVVKVKPWLCNNFFAPSYFGVAFDKC